MIAGAMQFTLMPSCPTSRASARVNPIMPALAEDIDGAEPLDGGIDHPRDILDLADIGADRHCVATGFPDGLHDGVGGLLVLQTVHQDVRAFGPESFGNAAAEATTAAGNECDLPRQPACLVHCPAPFMRRDCLRGPSTCSIGRAPRRRGSQTRWS